MAKNDLPLNTVLEISLREMTRMGHEYSTEWTNTWMRPWDAPEYVYTTAIGRSIRAATPGCVFLELNIDTLKQDSRNAGLRGAKSKTTTKQSKVDVAVYRTKDGYPIFCMEVKKSHTDKKEIKDDIKRCQEMVISAAQGSLNEAAVVFFAHQKRSEKKNKGVGDLQKLLSEGFEGHNVVGLDRCGKLTSTFSNLDIQEYNHRDLRGYEWEWEEGYLKEIDWAAVAIRIQE